MIFDNNAKTFGLLRKSSGIANVAIARTGTAGGVIVGKHQPSGIEVQSSSEDPSWRKREQVFKTIGQNFFSNQKPFEISEHTYQSLFWKPAQRPVEVAHERIPV